MPGMAWRFRSRRLFIGAICTIVTACGCGDFDYDPHLNVSRGEDARPKLFHCDREKIPASATEFWVYDGGNVHGSIYYVSFRCATLDDCWAAVAAFRGPDRSSFKPGVDTKYAVNRHGPRFYFPDFKMTETDWNIDAITNGMFYEQADRDRHMEFWAIDKDSLRVYYHYESGGFPTDPPNIKHR
jgi:hypothetical protein